MNDKDLNNADKSLVEGAREVEAFANETDFHVSEATLEMKDEICSDETYNAIVGRQLLKKRTCSLKLFPEDTENIEEFRKKG